MPLGKGLNSLIPPTKSRRIFHRETGDSRDQEKVWQIPLSEIVPNAEQPRRTFSHAELEDLIASIKKHGVLQPITVVEKTDGGYELIAGERRLRASQMAGLATVPALVRTATRQQKLELALIENIQRQDLNPIEEAFAYERLMQEFGLTQQEVSEVVGKNRSTIANAVRLLTLPEAIKKGLIENKVSPGQAKALLGLANDKERLAMFQSMVGEKMSVRDLERSVGLIKGRSGKGLVRRDPNLLAQEKMLEERLGSKVQITQKGEQGKIIIEYYSQAELKRLMEELS
ncbi:MAG TPA: ParB/RepB/Spo0J family partition protein [Patescibacteria group bacterium]|nr:ParB/RepB/Spo0J family partition protein [Patescibacteria group bacterium]